MVKYNFPPLSVYFCIVILALLVPEGTMTSIVSLNLLSFVVLDTASLTAFWLITLSSASPDSCKIDVLSILEPWSSSIASWAFSAFNPLLSLL